MAALTCDPFSNNTLANSAQISSCQQKNPLLATYELSEEVFLAVILDMLQRLAVAGVAGFQPLTDYIACDSQKVSNEAFCKFANYTLPINFDPTEVKAQVLWMLGAPVCENEA